MWNSKNSGERASGVRNHTRLRIGLFGRRNSGLSDAGLGAASRSVHRLKARSQNKKPRQGVSGTWP